MSPPDLSVRLAALDAALAAADGRLDESDLAEARAVTRRSDERLRLSPGHTVVALAGATGSGKSSLFNALVGFDLAGVGVRRPTTGRPMACVWGIDGAGPLLDWLGIPTRHQAAHESALDPAGGDGMDGLVLLDLPDHDSTTLSHRLEVDRLVRLVDLFVWVVDPQKYADAALHEGYLRRLSAHAEVTVVVLNQVDRLSPAERAACLADLGKLLAADGLGAATVLAASARTGEGVPGLRATLRRAVERRHAIEARLTADVRLAAAALLDAVGPVKASAQPPGRDALVDALADAAGVPAVVHAVRGSVLARSRAATGWPVTRWLGRLRPDPVRRLRLDRGTSSPDLVRTSLPAATPVQRARTEVAVRRFGNGLVDGAPAAAAELVREAARDAHTRLPDRLDRAVAGVDLGVAARPRWWPVAGALQWAATAVSVVGLLWLLLLWGFAWLRVPEPPTPEWNGWPLPTLMLLGGIAASLIVAGLARLLSGLTARRRAARARRRLVRAISEVADEVVVAPLQAELDALVAVRSNAETALR